MQTYRSLEARFPYYDFSDVTIDRYQSERGPRVVAVAVRELDPTGIQDPNWQNRHLRDIYIRGMGAAVSRAASMSPQGRPDMLISGIPPERMTGAGDFPDLRLDRPEVYFGSRPQLYALLDPASVTPSTGGAAEGAGPDDLPAGIVLRSRLRTALLAWQFADANLFFASDLTDETRLIYRRQIHERVQAVAPFLRFPEMAHAVVADGRLVWMLEGFTGTRAFPAVLGPRLRDVPVAGQLRAELGEGHRRRRDRRDGVLPRTDRGSAGRRLRGRFPRPLPSDRRDAGVRAGPRALLAVPSRRADPGAAPVPPGDGRRLPRSARRLVRGAGTGGKHDARALHGRIRPLSLPG
jgi:hypothetical protein